MMIPRTPTEDEADEVLLAARYGDLDDVRAFADAFGPDALAAARDANGNSALHMAAANGHVDVLAYLFPRVPAAALGAPNAAGSTPLHWAALNKQLAAAQALVGWAAGPGAALVDAKNAAGRSPLGEAEHAGWDDGARWLVSVMDLGRAGAPTEGPPEEEADGEGEGDVKIAAKAGADGKPVTVEITDSEGRMASMTLDDLKNAKD